MAKRKQKETMLLKMDWWMLHIEKVKFTSVAREKYGEMSLILEQQNADGDADWKGKGNGKEKEKKKVNAGVDAKKKEQEKKKKIGNDDGRDRDVYGLEQVDEKKVLEDVKLEIELELDEKETDMVMNDNNKNNSDNKCDNLNDNNRLIENVFKDYEYISINNNNKNTKFKCHCSKFSQSLCDN